jgi:Mn2+/Fe2+ NRAMP family transporter
MRKHYPSALLQGCVLLLLIANTVAIGADLGAMADVLGLLIGGPHLLYVILFGALCVTLQVFMRYSRYVAVLKWTTLSLLGYFAAMLLAHVSWSGVAAGLVPRLPRSGEAVTAVVAVFGVALSVLLATGAEGRGPAGEAGVHALVRHVGLGAPMSLLLP